MAGRLIVLEGPDGGGKSTNAGFVAQWLESRGRQVVRSREPGGSPLAEQIRSLLLADGEMPAASEVLLMYAARAAHLAQTIAPALAAGSDVVCDRFVDASYAYQGAGRGVPVSVLDQLSNYVLGELRPDLVILLDLPLAAGQQRTRGRGAEDRFDREQTAFRSAVRQAYLQRAQAAPEHYAVVDASAPLADVQHQIALRLERL